MQKKLRNLLNQTLEQCFQNGSLYKTGLPDYVIEIPKNPDHGHFATNLALVLTPSQKKRPREIAQIIMGHFKGTDDFIEKVEMAGPGFINFRIKDQEWYKLLLDIVSLQNAYGSSQIGAKEKIMIEFVSANPTGPLHLGQGRGAALGDTLCRILAFTGYDVFREYYINDAGQQVRLLGESIYARFKQLMDPAHPFPENGYQGDYINELAKAISGQTDLSALSPDQAVQYCSSQGMERMLVEIKRDLAEFRVSYDNWYRESTLIHTGLLEETLQMIRAKGGLYEKEGALWIRTSAFGDDKDRVLRKADGQYTYFATDIAYHMDKWRRGFQRVVNIWGADHHGYVDRMQAAMQTSGPGAEWLIVLLLQLVKLWKGGQEIKMSKRAGQYVTLKELMDEVGVDAARFVFLTKHHDSSLDFDIDLVKRQDADNPVYYVQYAHARICSIFRKAEEEGLNTGSAIESSLSRLELEDEKALIRFLADFPVLLESIALHFEAHRLTYYLTELAAMFHRYFNLGNKEPQARIITADKELSLARLCLAEAVRVVLCNGLTLLGSNAPERM
jgi:arginyl-tRNA synthetase